jgi:hypothetical protein
VLARGRGHRDHIPQDGLAGVDLLDDTPHLQEFLYPDHRRYVGDRVLGEL